MMSLAVAYEIPSSRKNCRPGDMPAYSISSLRGVVFEENVRVKVDPPSSATEMGLQLTYSTVVSPNLGGPRR